MNLVFKARIINEIENERKVPFTTVAAEFSQKTVLTFLKKGLGVDEAGALDAIDKYIEDEGGNLMKLYVEIITKLEESGFLDPGLEIGKSMKEALSKPLTASSGSNGGSVS